jgi:hypothetical protein
MIFRIYLSYFDFTTISVFNLFLIYLNHMLYKENIVNKKRQIFYSLSNLMKLIKPKDIKIQKEG